MKSTFELQNAPRVRALLKAQSSTYGSVKVIRRWRFVVCILTVVGVTFFVKKYESLVIYSAYYALVAFGLSIFLSIMSERKRKHAAVIQQTVDAEIFCMKDIPYVLHAEEITQLVAKFTVSPSEYKDWYSDYSKLPFVQQIFRCQQENLRWDVSVRRNYFWVVATASVAIAVIVHAVILYCDYSVKQALAIAVSCLPFLQYVIQLLVDISNSIMNVKMIKTFSSRVEDVLRAESDYSLFTMLQLLQLSIFEHRRRSVTVPDIIYRTSRQSQQTLEDRIAKNMV